MLGKLGEMGGMLKKAQEMKKQFGKMKEELETVEVKGTSGGNNVEVIANGNMQIKSIKINPDCIKSEDSEILEEMVLSAVNNAIGEAQKAAQKQMSAITGGLNIPGLF